MAGVGVGLVLALLQGLLLSAWLWPGRAKPVVTLAALAPLAGLAASSSAFFLWVVVSGGRATWFPALELAGTVLLAALAWRRAGRVRFRGPRWESAPLEWVTPVALALAVALVLAMLVLIAAGLPWGYWDAWAMINLKARFLAAGGTEWSWVFEGPGIHHKDYPLLLSCSVARLWAWSSALGDPGFPPFAGQAVSVLTWGACLAGLLALVSRLCAPGMAPLAGVAFLALGWDLQWGGLQYADFAQGALFVWGAGVLALARRRPGGVERYGRLLGFLVGASAWCKNEGLAFAVVLLAAALVTEHGRRAWAQLVAGALLPGLAVAVLKLGFVGASSVFGERARPVWADLADVERYRALAGFVHDHVTDSWTLQALPVVLVGALLLPRRSGVPRVRTPLFLLWAITAVFALVMLTTRERYDWHVGTAVNRLLLQLWPLAILSISAWLRPR